jgi:uncharacterized OB-fold protein
VYEALGMPVERYRGIPFVARFRWTTGEIHEFFLERLKDKKVVGARCSCGYVVVPPRVICPRCLRRLSLNDLVEVSQRGVVVSKTSVKFKMDSAGNYEKTDETLVAVRLHGTNSTLFLKALEPVNIGDEVEIIWREEREGLPEDIAGVRGVKA